ncbi:hypothetical protein ACVWZA_001614 [Sphingomonas sp. UYAg733]
MTLDGFLTFLALLIGALTIVPPVRRLQLQVAMGSFLLSSIVGTLAVLYFEFFDLVAPYCPAVLGPVCSIIEVSSVTSSGPQRAAFAVVFVWLVIGLVGAAWPRVHVRAMPTIERLVTKLAETHRFSELVDFIEPGLAKIDETARRQRPFQRRYDRIAPAAANAQLDKWINSLLAREASLFENAEAPRESWPDRAKAKFKNGIVWFVKGNLPSGAREQAAAEGILRTLLSKREIIEYIAEFRPAFGARLLHFESYEVDGFSERFLEQLIARPGSALYEEIRGNGNLANCGYDIPSHNAVLHSVLDDATVAQRLEVYRPLGEYVLAQLNPVNSPEYCRSLNAAYDHHWNERGRWRDPTYVTIRFFDIMVQAAACQNVDWHMWLYYMPHFIDNLEALYDDSGERVDKTDEWPTRAAQLIYWVFDAMRDWVRVATKVPTDSRHRLPDNDRVDHENGNIPKSAALAMGMCLKTVMLSARIGDRFKQSILELALGTVRDMSPDGDMARLRRVTLKSIAQGGISGGGERYEAILRDFYRGIDKPWHHDFDDFEILIGYPEPEQEAPAFQDDGLSAATRPPRRGWVQQILGIFGFS